MKPRTKALKGLLSIRNPLISLAATWKKEARNGANSGVPRTEVATAILRPRTPGYECEELQSRPPPSALRHSAAVQGCAS